jgi:hypothetical protein
MLCDIVFGAGHHIRITDNYHLYLSWHNHHTPAALDTTHLVLNANALMMFLITKRDAARRNIPTWTIECPL